MKSKTYRKLFFSFFSVIIAYSVFVIFVFTRNEIHQYHAEQNMKSQLLLQSISFQMDQQLSFAINSFHSLATEHHITEYRETSLTNYGLYALMYDDIKKNNVLMNNPGYSIAVMNLDNDFIVSSDGYFLRDDFFKFLSGNQKFDVLLNEIIESEFTFSLLDIGESRVVLLYKDKVENKSTYFFAYWRKNEMSNVPIENLVVSDNHFSKNEKTTLSNFSKLSFLNQSEQPIFSKTSNVLPFVTYSLSSENDYSGLPLATISSLLLPIVLLGLVGTGLMFILSKRTYKPYLEALNAVKASATMTMSDNELSLAMQGIVESSTSLNKFQHHISNEIKELFIKSLLLNEYDIVQARNLLPSFHLEHLDNSGFIVFLSFLGKAEQDVVLNNSEIRQTRKLLLYKVLSNLKFEAISFNEKNFAIIVTEHRQSEMLTALDEFRKTNEISPELNMYYFLSKPFTNLETFKVTFLESYDWLAESFTESLTEQSIIRKEDTVITFCYSVEKEQQLIHYLKVEDFSHAETLLQSILNTNLKTDSSLKNIFDFSTAICLTLKRIILERNIEYQQFYERNKTDFALLRYGNSPEQAKNAIQDIFADLIATLKNMSTSSKSKTDEIIQYINQNYETDLYLGEISERFGLTESYVSRLIKEKLDTNFKNYLNNLRIQKAKNIILSENLLIQDISKRVGFKNVNSFIRVFKQIEGMTPGQFQRKNNQF